MATKQYTVRSGQNIYDIALELHGTVEGIFDLLVNNGWLSMETTLQYGQVLNYSDDFVVSQPVITWLSRHGIVVKNGDHACDFCDAVAAIKQHIYSYHHDKYEEIESSPIEERESFWDSLTQQRIVVNQRGRTSSIGVMLFPERHMFIDWGDYSNIDVIDYSESEKVVEHCYLESGEHEIRVYGDFGCYLLDISELNGVCYFVAPTRVDCIEGEQDTTESNELIIKV